MNIQSLISALPQTLRRHAVLRWILAFAPGLRRQQITFNGNSKLVGDISDPCVRNYFLTGSFEPEFFAIAQPLLNAGGVFFDIGANFGFCTFGLLKGQSGTGLHCHLFEANEVICDYLQASRWLHPNSSIEIVQAVVTDKPGETRFDVNPAALGESTVAESGEVSLRNVVLDNYVRQHKINCVDFAKLDIEGWEPVAFRGCLESLRAGIFKVIYFEVAPSLLARHGFSPADSIDLLREYGYQVFFCKAEDGRNMPRASEFWAEYSVSGKMLFLAPVRAFPDTLQTDLLAVHQSALG